MTTELQNKVWSILPKEFKEEVKDYYKTVKAQYRENFHLEVEAALIRERIIMLEYLFGHHNLTSDAEEEELLTCEKYKVEEALNYCDELDSISGSHNMLNWGKQMIVYLFGSKCLLDETKDETKEPNPAEPKYHVGQRMAIKYINKIGTIDAVQGYNEEEDGIYYHLKVEPKGVCTAREENLQPYEEPKPVKPFKVGDKVRILSLHGMPTPDKGEIDVIAHINIGNREQMYYLENHYHCAYGFSESDLEPYTEPTAAKQDKNSFQNGNTSNYSGNHFPDVRNMVNTRLHIAAMAMAGALANKNVTIGRGAFEDNLEYITKTALMYADALIAECEKGGNDA